MTAVPADRPALKVTLPVEELASYAGLIGLVTATLAVAGVFASTAYLSAWHVPAPVIRLDPVTAALRSDAVIYQSLGLAFVVFGVDRLIGRLAARPRARLAALAVVGLLLALVAVDAVRTGVFGPALTAIGGVGLLALHQGRRLAPRAVAIGFVLLALVSAYQTGAEMGRLVRDGTVPRVAVALTTRSEVPGLGGAETGAGWSYAGLYLVFRDGESLYVARGSEASVWVIPAGNVMGLAIGW